MHDPTVDALGPIEQEPFSAPSHPVFDPAETRRFRGTVLKHGLLLKVGFPGGNWISRQVRSAGSMPPKRATGPSRNSDPS